MRKAISRLLFSISLAAAPQLLSAEEAIEVTDADSGETRSVPRLDSEQLDELLGPIALYPDSLVALILPAATMPTDLVLASRYLKADGETEQLDVQPWDESVRSLARYPEVVKWMDERLSWSIMVGDAFLAQPVEVMQSIQRLRSLARESGALVDTGEQRVIEEEGHIRIVPARPEVIYVPVYDPQVVYVTSRPAWGWSTSVISFSWCYPSGIWLAYDCDWRNHRVWVVNSHWRSRWYNGRECRQPYAYRRHHHYENRDYGCGWTPRREHRHERRHERRERIDHARERHSDGPRIDRDGGRWDRSRTDREHHVGRERSQERRVGEPVRRRESAVRNEGDVPQPGGRENRPRISRGVGAGEGRPDRGGLQPPAPRVREEARQDGEPGGRDGFKQRVQPRPEPSRRRDHESNPPPAPPRGERGAGSVRNSEQREAPAVEERPASAPPQQQVRPPRGETARRIRSGDTERRRPVRRGENEG